MTKTDKMIHPRDYSEIQLYPTSHPYSLEKVPVHVGSRYQSEKLKIIQPRIFLSKWLDKSITTISRLVWTSEGPILLRSIQNPVKHLRLTISF